MTYKQHDYTNAADTHIGWPLKTTHKPKPAKECACPAQKKKFSKMPQRAAKKKKGDYFTQKYQFGQLDRLTHGDTEMFPAFRGGSGQRCTTKAISNGG